MSDLDVRLELARLAACQIDAAVSMLQRENSRERIDQDLLDFCLARIRELARVSMSVQGGEGAWSTAQLVQVVNGLLE